MAAQRIEREIVIDAPVEVVWSVVTEPEHIAALCLLRDSEAEGASHVLRIEIVEHEGAARGQRGHHLLDHTPVFVIVQKVTK